MLILLNSIHEELGTAKAAADYLGYSLRGYMKIRERIKGGRQINARTEALIKLKLSQLKNNNNNKESQS